MIAFNARGSSAFRTPEFGARRDYSRHMLRPTIQPFAHLIGVGIDVIDAGNPGQASPACREANSATLNAF